IDFENRAGMNRVRTEKRFFMRISSVQLVSVNLVFLLGSALYGATAPRQIKAGEKATVRGTIASSNGDLVMVRETKSDAPVIVALCEDTKFERRKGKFEFFRHTSMDATAMVPGLTIEARGVGNAKGQLEAKAISFTPDVFAIEVAEEKQILANKAATETAQST